MDLASMNHALQGVLVGTVCVHAWTGYGDPLFASFRRDRTIRLNAPREREAGSIELQTNFSDWTVSAADGVVDGGPAGRNPHGAAERVVGKAVVGVSVVDDYALVVQFEDGTKLRIARWHAEPTLTDAWCINLDNGNVLAVPTIGRPQLVDSTSAIRDWFASGPLEPDEPSDERERRWRASSRWQPRPAAALSPSFCRSRNPHTNMSTRFEILKNGKRVCISGITGDGVLSVGVTYVKHPGQNSTHDLQIGGLGVFDGSQDRQHHAAWPSPDVATGDEITIRILPPGEYDQPHGMTGSPRKTIDDPELGKLNYYIDSWDADIVFASAPIESAHIHLRADDSGPTQHQRDLLRELRSRHMQLWSEIRSALVKCHPEIKTIDELSKRLVSHVGINMYDDTNTIEITYRVEGDPEFRAYFVTLRDWEIAEVCMAE